jgi:uncharacterized membrane protein YfcA
VESGAQLIQWLKRTAHVDWAVGLTFILVLACISGFMTWEVIATSRRKGITKKPKFQKENRARSDPSAAAHISKWVHRLSLPPYVRLPVSGIERVSVWAILLVAYVGGLFSGFLGGGAGYIRMPCLIYLLGIPTHIAVGTDLFEIIISAGYGTVTHAVKGNVDILIALVMHTGAAIGAQIGATLTQFFAGPRIRMAFIPLPLIGAVIVVHGLLSGHGAK